MTHYDIGAYRFSPRLVPTLAALIVCASTFALGQWQTRRAQEKTLLQQRLDRYAAEAPLALGQVRVAASDLVDRRVVVRGSFVADQTLFIDNRLYGGVPGYQVVTPLHIEGGSMHVLVNRGWVPAGPSRAQLPQVKALPGTVVVEGIASVPLAHPYELQPDTSTGAVRQNVVLERIAADTQLALQPVVLLQTSASDDGLVRDWPKPDAGVTMHQAYALQWYAMAATALVLWVTLNLKRKP